MKLSNASKTVLRILERERQDGTAFAYMRLSMLFPELTNSQVQRLMKNQAELEISETGEITYNEGVTA